MLKEGDVDCERRIGRPQGGTGICCKPPDSAIRSHADAALHYRGTALPAMRLSLSCATREWPAAPSGSAAVTRQRLCSPARRNAQNLPGPLIRPRAARLPLVAVSRLCAAGHAPPAARCESDAQVTIGGKRNATISRVAVAPHGSLTPVVIAPYGEPPDPCQSMTKVRRPSHEPRGAGVDQQALWACAHSPETRQKLGQNRSRTSEPRTRVMSARDEVPANAHDLPTQVARPRGFEPLTFGSVDLGSGHKDPCK